MKAQVERLSPRKRWLIVGLASLIPPSVFFVAAGFGTWLGVRDPFDTLFAPLGSSPAGLALVVIVVSGCPFLALVSGGILSRTGHHRWLSVAFIVAGLLVAAVNLLARQS